MRDGIRGCRRASSGRMDADGAGNRDIGRPPNAAHRDPVVSSHVFASCGGRRASLLRADVMWGGGKRVRRRRFPIGSATGRGEKRGRQRYLKATNRDGPPALRARSDALIEVRGGGGGIREARVESFTLTSTHERTSGFNTNAEFGSLAPPRNDATQPVRRIDVTGH
ncbi:hypothetical protein MRX96_003704 [Rhipicephalus microplus]